MTERGDVAQETTPEQAQLVQQARESDMAANRQVREAAEQAVAEQPRQATDSAPNTLLRPQQQSLTNDVSRPEPEQDQSDIATWQGIEHGGAQCVPDQAPLATGQTLSGTATESEPANGAPAPEAQYEHPLQTEAERLGQSIDRGWSEQQGSETPGFGETGAPAPQVSDETGALAPQVSEQAVDQATAQMTNVTLEQQIRPNAATMSEAERKTSTETEPRREQVASRELVSQEPPLSLTSTLAPLDRYKPRELLEESTLIDHWVRAHPDDPRDADLVVIRDVLNQEIALRTDQQLAALGRTGQRDIEDLAGVMRSIDSIAPDPERSGVYTLTLNGQQYSLSDEEVAQIRADARSVIEGAAAKIDQKATQAQQDLQTVRAAVGGSSWFDRFIAQMVDTYTASSAPELQGSDIQGAHAATKAARELAARPQFERAAALIGMGDRAALQADHMVAAYRSDLIGGGEELSERLQTTADACFTINMLLAPYAAVGSLAAAGAAELATGIAIAGPVEATLGRAAMSSALGEPVDPAQVALDAGSQLVLPRVAGVVGQQLENALPTVMPAGLKSSPTVARVVSGVLTDMGVNVAISGGVTPGDVGMSVAENLLGVHAEQMAGGRPHASMQSGEAAVGEPGSRGMERAGEPGVRRPGGDEVSGLADVRPAMPDAARPSERSSEAIATQSQTTPDIAHPATEQSGHGGPPEQRPTTGTKSVRPTRSATSGGATATSGGVQYHPQAHAPVIEVRRSGSGTKTRIESSASPETRPEPEARRQGSTSEEINEVREAEGPTIQGGTQEKLPDEQEWGASNLDEPGRLPELDPLYDPDWAPEKAQRVAAAREAASGRAEEITGTRTAAECQGDTVEAATVMMHHQQRMRVINTNELQHASTLVDISTTKRFESCKCHGLGDTPSSSDADKYTREMNLLVHPDFEIPREAKKVWRAVDEILGMKDDLIKGKVWPESLGANPTREEVLQELNNNAVLRVPDNHVQSVRAAIDAKIRQLPGNWGLDPKAPTFESDVSRITSRVRGCGVSTSDFRGALWERFPGSRRGE